MNEKKHWYQKAWGKVVATVSILGILAGIFEGVYLFTEMWHDYKELQEKVKNEDYDNRIKKLEIYVTEKRKSFAVGFRVFKEFDEETGKITYQKRYRDWEGIWHEIYYDLEASELYGVDYYYYIKRGTGEKIYCW